MLTSGPMSLPPLRTALPWLVLLGVVLRLGLLGWNFSVHPELLAPHPAPSGPGEDAAAWGPDAATEPASAALADRQPHLSAFGFEASNVAAALVCRDRGLADPFGVPSGATGWVSPGVVALYAVPFLVSGCFTPGSVVLVFLVALALSAGLVVLSAATARRLWGDHRITLVAAFLAAVSPFDLRLFAAASTLELNLHAFLLLLLVYLLLGLRRSGHGEPAVGRLAGVAGTAAVATLFNPVFLAVVAGGLPLALVRRQGEGRRWRVPGLIPGLALLAAAQVVVVAPYLLYQRAELGAWIFVKSNAAFEIALGNRPGDSGVLQRDDFGQGHPSQAQAELQRYLAQGEVEYVRHHGRRFLERLEPARLVRMTLRRTAEYFSGMRHSAAVLAAAAEGGFPLRKALLAVGHGLVGAVFLLYSFRIRRAGLRFALRPRELLIYAAALLYAAPHLVAAVMPRYVLPVTPLALLLGAAVAVRWISGNGRHFAPLGSGRD